MISGTAIFFPPKNIATPSDFIEEELAATSAVKA